MQPELDVFAIKVFWICENIEDFISMLFILRQSLGHSS